MRWWGWIIVVFAMHLVWEMWQARWFSSMAELPFRTGTLVCLRATFGDLVITGLAFLAAAASARALLWPVERLSTGAVVLYLAAGLTITIVVEIVALRAGRWSYADEMPTLLGIGVLPLAQWIILPLAGLLLFRVIWRRA